MNSRLGKGALAHQNIKGLMDSRMITDVPNIENIQPSSFDLSLSTEIYKVPGIFLPEHDEKMEDVLANLGKEKHSLDKPLEIGKHYVVRLNERLELPKSLYGYANPKSSTGRLDCHVRLLTDCHPRFDTIPRGYSGGLWLSIVPKSFRLLLGEYLTLNQVRLFTEDTRFVEFELESSMKEEGLVWSPGDKEPLEYGEICTLDNDGSIILNLGLGHKDNVGWEAVSTKEVVDMKKRNHDPDIFWKPLRLDKGHLLLKKDHFYILATHEGVRIPPYLASEIAPMDERSGEFRSHYAGFFDPGWGWGKEGEGKGDIGTLEVRPFEDIVVRHKQPICKFKFERMVEIPDVVYGTISGSNYTGQSGPKLSKHFGT